MAGLEPVRVVRDVMGGIHNTTAGGAASCSEA